jgi:hypothetical protein
VAEIEKTHPGLAFAIFTHRGFGNFNPLDIHSNRLEERMKSWPVPSLAPIKGTWLADLDELYYVEARVRADPGWEITDLADAYLYLGPRKSLLREPIPDDILNDQSYLDKLNKRPWAFQKVDQTWKSAPGRPLYIPIQGREYSDAQMPLTKYVGIYSDPSKSFTMEIDIHKDKLVAKLPAFPGGIALTPAGENRFTVGASVTLEFEMADSKVSNATVTEVDGSGSAKTMRLQTRTEQRP